MLGFAMLLLRVTVYSSVTAGLLLLLKRCLKFRIPPFLNAALWVVLLVRLFVPCLPESAASIFNLFPGSDTVLSEEYFVETIADTRDEAQENRTYIENLRPNRGTNAAEVGVDVSLFLEQEQQIAQQKLIKQQRRDRILTGILTVYIAGVLFCLLRLVASYFCTKRRVRRSSIPCESPELYAQYAYAVQKMRLSPKRLPPIRMGETSMLCGVCRPVLIVDYRAEPAQLPMIFLHELNHFIYKDNAVIFFSNVITALLWFNPLMWMANASLRDDLEVLCDSRTLEFASVDPSAYAELLCVSADPSMRRRAGAVYASSSGKRLVDRLKRIVSRNGISAPSRAAVIALSSALMLGCLTNPVSSVLDGNSVYIENCAALIGSESLNSTSGESVSGSRFYSLIYTTLQKRAGKSVSAKLGDGSLSSFTRRALDANVACSGFETYISAVASSRSITYEQAAVILNTVIQLISDGSPVQEQSVLPLQLHEDTMAKIVQMVSPENAKALLSCYSRGSDAASISLASCYSVETIVQIMEYIDNEWLRSKFIAHYAVVPIDRLPDGEYEDIVAVTEYDYVYLIRADVFPREERVLREILALTESGQREDVFYLKSREDLYSYRDLAALFAAIGFDRAQMYEEYARLGCSAFAGGGESVVWLPYVEQVYLSDTPSSVYAATAVDAVCRYGIMQQSAESAFTCSAKLDFGEAMHALCLLYASMIAQ